MVFRSKIDAWLGGVLLIGSLFLAGSAWYLFWTFHPAKWGLSPFLLLGAALTGWILLATYYVVTDSDLLVRSGPFRLRVPLSAISRITKSDSAFSAPALSLDRLAIEYGRDQTCTISPSNAEAFLQALRVRGVRAA
jgi:hypothetical protein